MQRTAAPAPSKPTVTLNDFSDLTKYLETLPTDKARAEYIEKHIRAVTQLILKDGSNTYQRFSSLLDYDRDLVFKFDPTYIGRLTIFCEVEFFAFKNIVSPISINLADLK